MTKRNKIFNLEFPTRCSEFCVSGYKFYRVENYETQLKKLQHRANVYSEFNIYQYTGEHSITAFVELPDIEEKSLFEWKENSTYLHDILLLISIFTGRDVFDIEESFNEDEHFTITADPRCFQFGRVLKASLPDQQFEIMLNQVFELVKTEEWQNKYSKGYFLLMAKQAFKHQIIETTFILCWIIMEHIYYILTNKDASKDKSNDDYKNIDVILYMFTEYNYINKTTDRIKKRLWLLSNLRNQLIHSGRFPRRYAVLNEAKLFIQIVESMIAKILNLTPSNIFNTTEKFNEFIYGKYK